MKGKWMRLGIVAGLGLLLVFAFAAATGAARVSSTNAAGYVGSQVCMGCHTGKFDKWSQSGHAKMVTRILTSADLPASPDSAPPELKNELGKAAYVVAGQRFIARDPKTGELTYLNVVFDKPSSTYKPYKGGSSWEKGCAGCHSTGIQKDKDVSGVEMGIGCEACHGPGREHVTGKGDRTKIVVNQQALTCGRCHNKGTSDDGSKWPNGWKIGMTLEEVGYHLTPVAKSDIPPTNLRQEALLEASGHLNAIKSLVDSGHDKATCYVCHSAEAKQAAARGKPITDMDQLRNLKDGVSCTACHSPHGPTAFPAQLSQAPETLCMSCHTSGLAAGTTLKVGSVGHHAQKEMFLGYGAIDVPPTKGIHTRDGVSCYNCHMTGGNHMFKVILPSEVKGTDRKDSCVSCHTGSTSTIRGAYLEMWQQMTMAKLDKVNGLLTLADEKVKANPNLAAELVDQVKTVKSNVSLITADKSKGAHNFEYAMTILEAAEKSLTEFGHANP